MLIPDVPNVPPQDAPVMIAQANQAQSGNTTTTRTLGVCSPVPNNNYSGENGLEPIGSAQDYFKLYESRTVSGPATTTIVQQPKHGVLRLITEADGNTFGYGTFDPTDPGYVYLPESGYVGNDSGTVQVGFGSGLKVNVKYYFQAISGPLGNTGLHDLCAKTGYMWKISSTLAPNGTSTITSIEYQSPTIDAGNTTTDVATLASTLDSSILSSLSVDPSVVTLNIANLPNAAVGQTVGTVIALDTKVRE